MNIITGAAESSTKFEQCNTKLKKDYLKKNIDMINTIMESVPGYCGSFGTGYPFYALKENLEGNLPVISEQLRYNSELYNDSKDEVSWCCQTCLKISGRNMPDLKQICKPCPKIKDSLKPRKVINRLPDIDMWMICYDENIEEAKEKLLKLFEHYDMHTSDVDPVRTIEEIQTISFELEANQMPSKMLPLDIHIVKYSEFYKLLQEMPYTLINASNNDRTPYLPIHPLSLRKTWQYDDVAYNFAFDYLFSLTSFNWEKELEEKFNISKKFIIGKFSNEELKTILDQISPESVKKRYETKEIQDCYESRINSWRK